VNSVDAVAVASVPEQRRRRALFRQYELTSLLAAADFVSGAVGAIAAPPVWQLFDREYAPTAGLPASQVIFVVLWFVVLRLFGAGDLLRPRLGRRSLRAVSLTLITMFGVVLVGFFTFPFIAPRGASLMALPLAGLATLLLRFAYLRVVSSPLLDRRLAVVGTDDAARRAAVAVISAQDMAPYKLVGFVEPEANVPDLLGVPVLSGQRDLWGTLRGLDIDLVVVGHTRSLPPPFLTELVKCFEHGVEAVPATTLYEELTGRVMVAALEADWYAELPTRAGGIYAPVKRLVDLGVAGLSFFFAPLLLLVALAILLDSGRPILLRQLRVGERGQRFVLFKFRTMRRDAETDGQPLWATDGDPRSTRVGRVLRQFHIDELPQLWNVLRGEMSLIGPRPERPEFVDRLSKELPLYQARALVRPGITGWAQVLYPYAGTVEENLAKLEYDLYYVRHFGPLLDLSIVLRTVATFLGLAKPAYISARLVGREASR
jgi:exopolysaccharide biosynthesis polyprenyl glycosylphosphotransferase